MSEAHNDGSSVMVLDATRRGQSQGWAPAGPASLFYDFVLRNDGASTCIFEGLSTQWRYWPGDGLGIGYGDILAVARPYVVDLPLDVDAWQGQQGPQCETIALAPAFTLKAGAAQTLQLQLHYSFVGRLTYHALYSWDITFRLILREATGEPLELLGETSWRHNRLLA